jgi:hypothetical protein
MAQFPIVSQEGLFEAVNYLASGPAGLGQNFDGFSAYQPAYMTGQFRQPYTVSTATTSIPQWYVAPINITAINPIFITTGTTTTQFIEVFFTAQPKIPFSQGDSIFIDGVIDNNSGVPTDNAHLTLSGNRVAVTATTTFKNISPTIISGSGTGPISLDIALYTTTATTYSTGTTVSTNTYITVNTDDNDDYIDGNGFVPGNQLKVTGNLLGGTTPANDLTITLNSVSSFYNDSYTSGVLLCSTSSVILQTRNLYAWPTYISSGTIQKNQSAGAVSTDANARVTVQGPTQIVFISSQLTLDFTYTCSTASTFDVLVQINRYRGFIDTAGQGAVDYLFDYEATVSEQSHSYSSTSSGSASAGQNIFTTVLDQPSFGYFWYLAEVVFNPKTGNAKPETFTVGLRSLTAQVIKQ